MGESCIRCFDGETWGKKVHLEEVGIDGRIILKSISGKGTLGCGLD
jgi:hypothetical protein